MIREYQCFIGITLYCIHISDGCNTASFLTYGDRTVCIVARCTPFDSCTWVPFPHAVSAIIERQVDEPSSATNATNNTHDGADASGSDDATARATTAANIHGDSDLLVRKTNSNGAEEHNADYDDEEHNTEYDGEDGAVFDDGTAYDRDYVAGSESDSADGRAKAPEVQSVDKQQVSAWRQVFNKPLVSIVSCIVVIFFLAVVVFLVRYLVGLHERAVYKPLIDRFTTVSYSD